jgi:hypothetical protein
MRRSQGSGMVMRLLTVVDAKLWQRHQAAEAGGDLRLRRLFGGGFSSRTGEGGFDDLH